MLPFLSVLLARFLFSLYFLQFLLKILRVDHAGEFGADRIYAGQMFVLGKTDVGDLIQEMWDQEKEHKVSGSRGGG